MTMDTAETVRRFVAETFLFEANGDLSSSQSLLDSGVIDSTGVLELVMFLDKTFHIEIADKDLVPENLDSIDNIVRFIERSQPTGMPLRKEVA
jgi:acyl carrier protein